MALFSAHFDESGTPDQNHVVLTVAGCVSSVRKWARFESQWKNILTDFGLSEGTIFHMNKFARNIAPYDCFKGDSPRKAQFIARLVDCVRRNVRKACACSVVLRDWEQLNLRYCVSESLGFPYSFCGRTCVAMSLKWARQQGNAPIEIFFEKGAKHQGHLDRIVKANEGIDLGFRSKEAMIQFQAADLIAWKSHKVLTQVVLGGIPPEQQPAVYQSINRSLEAIRGIDHKYGVHSYESMERVILKAGVPLRRNLQ